MRALAALGAGALVVALVRGELVDLPDWLDENDGAPARLVVAVDDCADGLLTTEVAEGDGDDRTVTALRFDMGTLQLCDTTLEHTEVNDAAFRQDDTPRDVHGAFASFVARAAEVMAAGSRDLDDLGAPPDG